MNQDVKEATAVAEIFIQVMSDGSVYIVDDGDQEAIRQSIFNIISVCKGN